MLLAMGCAPATPGGPEKPPTAECPAGERTSTTPDSPCEPILPAADCPAGTRPDLGNERCVAVGWTSCPDGFVSDSNGWGCRDVLSAAACEGATREHLGSAACEPIGDCNAAFPPSEATWFVDAALTSPSADGRHLPRISDALTSAPEGAVIAVEAGTYAESLLFRRSVRLVGRCAERVVLANPAGTKPGLSVGGGKSVEIDGFTVRGYRFGAAVTGQAQLQLKDALLFENRELGVYVAGTGSKAVLQGVVVRATKEDARGVLGVGVYLEAGGAAELESSALVGNHYVGLMLADPASTGALSVARLHRTVIRDTHAVSYDGTFGTGLFVESASQVDLKESVLANNQSDGVLLRHARAQVSLQRTVVRNTRPNDKGLLGYGVQVLRGGQLDLTETSLVANSAAGLLVDGALATAVSAVRVTSSVIAWTLPNAGFANGHGVAAQNHAQVELTDSALVGNADVSLLVQEASSLQATRSLVRDTQPNTQGGYGRGISVQTGSLLDLSSCAVVASRDSALLAADPQTRATLRDSVLLDTRAQLVGGAFGHGIVVTQQALLSLEHSVIQRSEKIGRSARGVRRSIGWRAQRLRDEAVLAQLRRSLLGAARQVQQRSGGRLRGGPRVGPSRRGAPQVHDVHRPDAAGAAARPRLLAGL